MNAGDRNQAVVDGNNLATGRMEDISERGLEFAT